MIEQEQPMARAIDRETAVQFLKTHDKYLLVCHAHPDGDTLGAAIGLAVLLGQLEKQVKIVCESEIPNKLKFLTAYAPVTKLKPDEGKSGATVVTVDVASPALLGDYETRIGADGTAALAIDHHGTHTPFAKQILLDAKLSACAELVFDLAQLLFGYSMENPMPRQLAVPLYTGISTDSGNFMYSSVTAATHLRAAVLLASDVRHYEICAQLYENVPLSEVRAKRAAYDLMTLHFDNRVGMAIFTDEVMKQYELCDEDIDNIANLIRSIEGVLIAVHVKFREKGVYKVSMRSQVGYDVSAVCAAFGGGGHVCAAGCTLENRTPEEMQTLLLRKIGEILS